MSSFQIIVVSETQGVKQYYGTIGNCLGPNGSVRYNAKSAFQGVRKSGSAVDHFDWIRARPSHIYTNQVSYM